MRPDALPDDVSCYKRIGPFRGDEIPQGLRREHRLKDGVWGRVSELDGSLIFVWDDGEGGASRLESPAVIVVPPTVPHHLEDSDEAQISIEFFARS